MWRGGYGYDAATADTWHNEKTPPRPIVSISTHNAAVAAVAAKGGRLTVWYPRHPQSDLGIFGPPRVHKTWGCRSPIVALHGDRFAVCMDRVPGVSIYRVPGDLTYNGDSLAAEMVISTPDSHRGRCLVWLSDDTLLEATTRGRFASADTTACEFRRSAMRSQRALRRTSAWRSQRRIESLLVAASAIQ